MTPCEIAAGGRDKDGYVLQWFQGRTMRAHRVAWIKANGPIPAGIKVLHRCDNPPCRNLEHLFLGTDADNHKDKALKGRAHRLSGERNGRAKLTARDVTSIHILLGHGISMHEIGRRFSVHWTTICSIRDGETWKARVEPDGEAGAPPPPSESPLP